MGSNRINEEIGALFLCLFSLGITSLLSLLEHLDGAMTGLLVMGTVIYAVSRSRHFMLRCVCHWSVQLFGDCWLDTKAQKPLHAVGSPVS
jgi:hypothetical protein